MGITIHGLEAMGYKPLGPGESVKGTFTRVDVFEIQGFILDVPSLPPIEESINSVRFKLGFGAGLNEVCKTLVGDDYVGDEEQWKNDTRCTPPFMLLSFGPTGEYVGSGTHYKDHGDLIETYDSFREAKQELKKQVDAVVPPLLTSLSLTFSREGRPVRFLPRQSAVAGKSADGKTVMDVRIEFSAMGIVSRKLNGEEVKEKATLSINKSKTLDRKIAQFYYMGSNEEDLSYS